MLGSTSFHNLANGHSPLLAVAFVTALGAGLTGSLFKPFNSLFEKDAKFVYVDSGTNNLKFELDNPKPKQPSIFYKKYSSIVLKNEGDKAGIVTFFKVNDGEAIEQFYASYTATDLKLRKKNSKNQKLKFALTKRSAK